jgi:3-oxoacyl-[acyl-carrier protein] reductase
MESIRYHVAIITGAGRGVGRATALELARRGARVALVARTVSQLQEVAEEVQALGREALVVPTDITDEAQVSMMAEQVLSQLGRVDILVNNAGIAFWGEVENFPLEQWNLTLAVNLTGMFLCSRAVIEPMKQQRRGHIVNLSSGAGKHGYANIAAYCTSKFGVIGFSESLAAELGPFGIKVSSVLPGTVDTTFSAGFPRERLAGREILMLKPEEVAEAVGFLVSQPPGAWTQEMNLWPFKG